ncbi:MAG: lyase family protein, partial [Oscillospiraceae bacterium]
MKLWSGRFDKNTDALVDELNASIGFDFRMYRQDISGSLAHSAMLARQGIISKDDAEKIAGGLMEILGEIEAGNLTFGNDVEDVHMAIEGELTRRIGDAGKRLHTARSRNDQVALDLRLYLKQEIMELRSLTLGLLETILHLAERNISVIMPAYTHLQRAQPTTFAHYMMAYANMLRRDITRLEDCYERMDE